MMRSWTKTASSLHLGHVSVHAHTLKAKSNATKEYNKLAMENTEGNELPSTAHKILEKKFTTN